ncbi:MAG: aspartate carbamoyltransferase catalytic subunit [Deltaproteobacteria bacterium]|nr:aspartate carbamoyltransferase catalytic subunit [Deltaproteobacteria bacterium]
MGFRRKDLLGTRDLSADEIRTLLESAESFKEIAERPLKKVPALRGKTVVNLFFEPSTRTRTSFEIAAKRLSADAVNISASTSSVVKGESLLDTVDNLQAMAPDIIVVRHKSVGAAHLIAGHIGASVVNAGDGANEHPTQALLDLLTISAHKKLGPGLRVAIIGDIAHSRVARSNIWALTTLGITVRVCAPPTMLPRGLENIKGVEVCRRPEEALDGVDVVMMLRIQLERQDRLLFPSLRDYAAIFGLNRRRLALARPDAIVMHPGPMNRGVEITSDVADSEQAVILSQVSNGVALRMAVLFLLGGQGHE